MNMNRRTVLLGLGAAGVGSGALFASGAFTSVEADREVDLSVASDDGALLVLEEGEHGENIIGTDDQHEADVIKLEQDQLNENARTSFNDALDVRNEGSREVEFYVESDDHLGDDDILDFQVDGDSIVGGIADGVTLSSGGGDATIDIVVNLRDNDSSDLDDIEEVTFVAEVDES